jgi:hypothetical protein
MSRLTGNDAKSLMEAYAAVYTPQEISEEQVWEQVEEWVNSLVEEGYDLSEYSWEEMYEAYIEENAAQQFIPGKGQSTVSGPVTIYSRPRKNTGEPYQSPYARPRNANTTVRNSATGEVLQKPKMGGINDPKYRGQELQQAARARASQVKPTTSTTPANTDTNTGGNTGGNTRQPQPPAATSSRPSSRPSAAPAATSSKPPAAPARASSPANASTSEKIAGGLKVYDAQRKAGDMAGASKTGMDVWRAANPKLAAAADEKARIRGTQQTDNPLMKDFKSRLPMNSPSVQSPDVAKLGKGNQSLTQNPSAFKAAPAPTKPAPAATATSTPATTTTKPATTSTLSDLAKKAAQKPAFKEDFDVFDVVIGHLLDEGYADTEEAALAIMTNMSEEWRESIIEGGFPNVRPSNRPGDAGTSGLKLIQTPGGGRGYINKHSGGQPLPSDAVKGIMGGDLMVQNKNNKKPNLA